MIIIGIDPGKTGAICVMEGREVLALRDIPMLKVNDREVYDIVALATWLRTRKELGPEHAFLEKQQPLPPKMRGGQADWWSGAGFYMWKTLFAAFDIPYTEVRPQTWKKALMEGMPKEKSASLVRALMLYPSCSEELKRVKDHNRAEALLIAEWGRRQLNGH